MRRITLCPRTFFHFILVFTTLAGSGAALAVDYDAAVKAAASLSAGRLPAAWQAPLDGVSVDILRPLPEGRILAGAYETVSVWVSSNSRVPRFRGLSMYDARTGAMLWTYDRQPHRAERFWLIATDPVILLGFETNDGRTMNLLALDSRDGKKLWEASDFTLAGLAPSQGGGVILGTGKGLFGLFGGNLKARRLMDGTELWSVSLGRAVAGEPRIEVAGDVVYVLGKEVKKHKVADGAMAWEIEAPGVVHALTQFARFGDTVVLSDANGLTALDDASGKTSWTLRGEGRSAGLAVADDQLFALAAHDEGHDVLRLDSTGKVTWRAPLNGRARSALLIDETSVVVASETHLHSIDRADGRLLWRSLVPASFALAVDIPPWVLERAAGRVVLATPSALVAFNPSDGRRTLHTFLPGAQLPSPPYIAERFAVEALGKQLALAGITGRSSAASYAEAQVQQAQRIRDRVYAATRALTPSTASSVERQDARQSRELASHGVLIARQGALVQEQISQSFGRAEAATNLASSLTAAIIAFQEAGYRASFLARDRQYAAARDAFAELIADRFLVRTINGLGSGGEMYRYGHQATIFDLQTSRRIDFVLSPFLNVFGHVPRAVFEPTTRRFVFAGTGTDPERYRPIQIATGRFAAVQLIAVDADTLALQNPEPMRHSFAHPSAEQPLHGTSVLSMVLEADTESLARYFANLKAQLPGNRGPDQMVLNLMPRAPSPLMLAAYEGNERLVDWLLAQGATASKKDGLGWTAAEYARWAGHGALAARLAPR